ncbi:uncharacterized protein THITE_2113869 [Thermothielavioides terrestris NRRL 8126]|uniref:SAM and PH domain-containing protein n=1 Tax=Thermothielavioides terrestris (strain ATCC 38088 / NRRL 8126) TaxID=578455 RepID=G2R4C0_THETT|nr:uncharacterized protein THITE_2113869 [Thermothielavioides terrestris NRRL 8126]AEO66067.1 hypothetical protein THITE_2113869 [Thermothielavioides terrestris NRRL 8126]
MEQVQFAAREQPRQEMQQKARSRDVFFSAAKVKHRPYSVYTEFMESDTEIEHGDDQEDDSEVYSEFGDLEGIEDGDYSPRVSIGSSGQPSLTTLSTYDEVQTPRSLRHRPFPFEHDAKQQVEGPRGPHLFRSSMSSAQSIELQHALTLSPITPEEPKLMDFHLQDVHLTPLPKKKRDTGPFQFTDEELDTATLTSWTPEMVAQQMLNAGIELSAAERFVENDINGAILVTLKFEDLKELGITSFGVRTAIWEEIHKMRNLKKPEPRPETPIEDEPDKAVKRELRRKESSTGSRKQKPRMKVNDVITPLESVSIVGIEQVLPKPHHCSKGENCPKWKRNQRLMEAFKKDHPFIHDNGIIMIAGDPGNPETAEAIISSDDSLRPVSDAVPSVVASSDVMGPGSLPPLQYLQEATLRNIQARDPQENVRQFLDFQRPHLNASSEVPPTPPFEIFPQGNQQAPHAGLRSLPKLTIPSQPAASPPRREPQSTQARSARPVSKVIPSFRELSPSSDEATPTAPYRFGTPFSEMDVPVTVTEVPEVSRDISQSVPPDMNYRHNPAPPRSMSRNAIRRPSFPVMPALDENSIMTPVNQAPNPSFSQRVGQRPLQAPPRVQYSWSQTERPTLEKAVPPASEAPTAVSTSAAGGVKTVNIGGRLSPISDKPQVDMTGGNAISYQGLMRKRKTKMLRHEWHEYFFTLRGTRLTMHKDAAAAASMNKTLEYIDIDDYAIACSGVASGSKLNAAFKAMHIRRGSDDAKGKDDVGAFSFQLIPQDSKGGVKLRKRESAMPGALSGGGSNASSTSLPPAIEGAVNGTGKTHHFAVKTRDERIDWMRELMLARARKQKGEGFEVSVNGNMI